MPSKDSILATLSRASWTDDAEGGSAAGCCQQHQLASSPRHCKQRQPFTGRELPFLREHAPGPIKITLPSATQFPAISFKYGITDAVYRDPYALLSAITAASWSTICERSPRAASPICRSMRRDTATIWTQVDCVDGEGASR